MDNTIEKDVNNDSSNTYDSSNENMQEKEGMSTTDETTETGTKSSNSDNVESSIDVLKEELALANDKFIRLYSEFDNYRRRTAKEKLDLMNTAGADFFKMMLPVMDDFERAMKSINESSNVESLKEGVDLIFNKFRNTLTSKGLIAMESSGKTFDPEIHEAITQIPSPTPEMKGKVVDELEKGYFLNEKVIRYAKVVVGS